MEVNEKVIIIGAEHHNTLGVVRCFGMKGLLPDVIVYGTRNSCISKSDYASSVVIVENVKEALDSLLTSDYNGHPIVIACSDEVVWQMDERQAEFDGRFSFFKIMDTSLHNISYYMDKEVQCGIAKNCGVRVPKIYSCNNEEFPCIIKPLESINGGKHISRCCSRDDFDLAIKEYVGINVQIQQLLSIDEEIVIVGVSVNNEIIMPAYIHKIRETDGGTTFSSVHPIVKLPMELVASSKEIIARMSYEGLFGIEFIKSDNEYYFVEVNLRNDATCYSIAKAGVNLPYIYYLAAIGKDYNEEINNAVNEIYSIVEIRDFVSNVLHWKLTPLKWWDDYKRASCRYYGADGDNGPLKSAIINYLKSKI